MTDLAPYRTGLWLAEYLTLRCQLCRLYPSVTQSELVAHSLIQPSLALNRVPSTLQSHQHFLKLISIANIKQALHHRLGKGLLCANCHQNITWLPDPFEIDIGAGSSLPIQAATYYDYPMRQAIHAFKHSEDMTKLPLLVHALRQLPRPKGCHAGNSVIVPMPTTHQRLIKRGFDPVSILSVQLAKHWQIPLWHGVERVDDTTSQQGLSRAERLTNLEDAFALNHPPPVKRLLLFDDVATTGASLQALARTFQHSCNNSLPTPLTINPANTGAPQTNHSYQLLAYALAHGSQY